MTRRQTAIERTRGRLVALAPGRSLVDELIAERHGESSTEDQAEAQRARARR